MTDITGTTLYSEIQTSIPTSRLEVLTDLARHEGLGLDFVLQEVITLGYYERLSKKNSEGVARRFVQRESGVTNAVREAAQIASDLAEGRVSSDEAAERLKAIAAKLEKSESR